ncbi:phospholipase C 2 [Actinidia rufa]|uniref:Phosphoinositide phospholipase C n=1 Tax=Actinidia rufa TaxID=165716 RepID=A0A7J0DP24_9ERIC|nr:phospholipase C 2 [Actinidia rufa]
MERPSKQYFKVCFCYQRMFRLKAAEPTEDVKNVFMSYSENGAMTVDHLLRFLEEYQGERGATKEDAQGIFNSLKHFNIFQRKGLHLEAFFRYLLSDHNAPLSPNLGVHHDMKAPLAHYFLFTGHNSYLTGNQLSSDCSVDPIIKALERGVRVIELDLWPNATNDDVDVCHGGTLTTPVELTQCLQAIRDYAFIASEYPVIITFEDHLTPKLQACVADMVIKTFGAALFQPETELKELPSPESLKRKIIISTKPPKEYLESQMKQGSNLQKVKSSAKEESWRKESQADQDEIETDAKDESDEGDDHQDEDIRAVPEYRRLIAIHSGKVKGGVENWFFDDANKVKRLSLSEQKLENAAETYATNIVRFTQRNLLRVYPKGIRFDSSNYNPLVGWEHGAQMVALNMQGYGKYLWIMHGMFRANGGCGYVKKPHFLLNPNKVFNPNEELPTKTTLKVYLGEGWYSDFSHTHFDLYSPPDFYTRVGIAGVPRDTVMMRTIAIEDEWVPVWNHEFAFPLTVPELALLRIEVMEYDTSGNPDFGGQTCLPVSELRSGIRAVPLYNRKGEVYKSVRLLMHFKFV